MYFNRLHKYIHPDFQKLFMRFTQNRIVLYDFLYLWANANEKKFDVVKPDNYFYFMKLIKLPNKTTKVRVAKIGGIGYF